MFGYEFGNILDVSYGAYVVKGVYSGNTYSRTPNHKNEAAVATIKELLLGNIADIRQSIEEANTAVSIVQKLDSAIENISTKLSKMKELAKNAAGTDYSQVQVEEMQKEFRNLSKEINDIARGTEHNNNKIFTSSGKSISIPVGDGSKIDIFAKDFSFNAEDLDLTDDPETALSNVSKMAQKTAEYNKYLDKQYERLEDSAKETESEIEDVMGIELDNFSMISASEMSSNTENLLSDNPDFIDSQFDITPYEALKSLKNPD